MKLMLDKNRLLLLSTSYHDGSRQVIASFERDISKLSFDLVQALYAAIVHDSFVKGSIILFRDGIENLRLNGLWTLIAMTCGLLVDWFILLKYPEPFLGPKQDLYAQLETPS